MQRGHSCIEIRAKEKTSKRSSPIRDWSNDSTVGWYFRIGRVVVNHYTCNRLILISGFFKSGDLKFTR